MEAHYFTFTHIHFLAPASRWMETGACWESPSSPLNAMYTLLLILVKTSSISPCMAAIVLYSLPSR